MRSKFSKQDVKNSSSIIVSSFVISQTEGTPAGRFLNDTTLSDDVEDDDDDVSSEPLRLAVGGLPVDSK